MAKGRQLKGRIRSVQNTRKITKTMELVATSKLKRAQDRVVAARPYAQALREVIADLYTAELAERFPLLRRPGPPAKGGPARAAVILLTSNRGLAGGFNASILREARRSIRQLQATGKTVKLLTIGRKGRDSLRRDNARLIVDAKTDVGRPKLTFDSAQAIGERVLALFEAGEFDVCTIVYNRFRSAISQIVTKQQLIPFAPPAAKQEIAAAAAGAIYEFEPEETEILGDLLPRNLAVQIFAALLENAASEQGARMTAMDNATRNAGEMIDRLNITYNRSRQAAITKELIEIISGAEAL